MEVSTKEQKAPLYLLLFFSYLMRFERVLPEIEDNFKIE